MLLKINRENYLFGFVMAAVLFTLLCYLSKPQGAGSQDEADIYGTFDEVDARGKGITPWDKARESRIYMPLSRSKIRRLRRPMYKKKRFDRECLPRTLICGLWCI